MPPLDGFSDNKFSNYSDFKKACIALLRALKPYQSAGGARIKLGLQTGTHFDDTAAQLEGYARALWAVGSLVRGGDLTSEETTELISPYLNGLQNGTDPEHPEYWGPVLVRDQRMVEMEIISFALLAAPDAMFHNQTQEAQQNITTWLRTINGKDMPITNWLWFRVMTNLALVKVCGVPYQELEPSMKRDLDQMEEFYLDEGWAADGIWSDEGRQADYYSGSFAIQFSQLLFIRMVEDMDPARYALLRERAALFRTRAAEFATTFWRYFDSNGAAIPFGRSLTYRFAFAGFWAAAAFAQVELPAPMNDLGVVKGLLLRHFRWWSDKHDMFNVDGTLTIGFTYPNYYMSEDYNSPQSPYWAMKSFVALGLPTTHDFWTSGEKPLPQDNSSLATPLIPPMHIICHTGNHHFLLSAGQFCPWPLKATEAKYGKFAYSSHFGFSVPTGTSVMAQIAPDSTLALSKDQGDTWRLPWKVEQYGFGTASLMHNERGVVEKIPALYSVWKPWKDAYIYVTTILVAPCSRWPDWHIRIHQVKSYQDDTQDILVTQGGFAIHGRGAKYGQILPTFDDKASKAEERLDFAEGTIQHRLGALVCSSAGASGIKSLITQASNPLKHQCRIEDTQCEVLKPDANTNLMWPRTLIPTARLSIRSISRGTSATFSSGVFAISKCSESNQKYDGFNIGARWRDAPLVQLGKNDPTYEQDYIRIDEIPIWEIGDQ